MPNHRSLAPALISLALLAAGCGGGGGGSGSGGDGTGTTQPSGPAFSVSTNTIEGSGQLGGLAVDGTEVRVTNRRDSQLTISLSSGADWATIEPTSLDVPANGTAAFSVDASCGEAGEASANVTATGGGHTETVSVSIECVYPDVEVTVGTKPKQASGGALSPPNASLQFTASSDWTDPPKLDYKVTPDNDGVTAGAVLASPESGELTVGEAVAIELSVENCLHGTREPITTSISIEVEHADDIEAEWVWECDAGNPTITLVETYQGPLVSRHVVGTGETDNRGGVDVHPQAGRFAIVSVHVEHGYETVPEVAARLVARDGSGDGAGLEQAGDGPNRLETPEVYGETPFVSELLYRVPPERYGAGLDVRLEVDPDNRLKESDEDDNIVTVPLPDAGMHRTRPLELVVVPVHREPSAGETPPPSGLIPPEGVPSEAEITAVADAFWPAPTVAVRNHESSPGEPDVFALRGIDVEAGLSAWEDALHELTVYRTSQATESPNEVWVGYVDWPDESGAAQAACGLAYLIKRRTPDDIIAQNRSVLVRGDCPNALPHELGHNLGVFHVDAGCGSSAPHEAFPHADGGLGPNRVWDARLNDGAGGFVPGVPGTGEEAAKDIMSYCWPRFASDHSYREVQRWRIRHDPLPDTSADQSTLSKGAATPPPVAKSLLLAGRVDGHGRYSLTRHRLLDKAPKRAVRDGEGRHRLIVEVPGEGIRFERPLAPAYPAHDLDGKNDGFWIDRVPAPAGRAPTSVTIVDPEGRAVWQEWLFAE